MYLFLLGVDIFFQLENQKCYKTDEVKISKRSLISFGEQNSQLAWV